MKITVLSVLFATAILLTATIATSEIQYADALKGQGVGSSKYGSATKGMICGDRLCSEIPGGRAAYEEQRTVTKPVIPDYGVEQKGLPITTKPSETKRDIYPKMYFDFKIEPSMKIKSGTIQSSQDPGMGHDQHQLAVLLPPSDKMYKGILSYSASENVQLVALHGPITESEDMGQTIWTPDGDTKFALTLVDKQNKMGTWMFTGNALAVHTFNQDPFAITYSIATIDGAHGMMGHKMMQETSGCNCSEDGVCTCGASCACVQ